MKYFQNKKIHFIGIGGIGMCGLAELLHRSGSYVTGSDLTDGKELVRLKHLGILIYIGHSIDNLEKDIDLVVYSGAVPKTNVEIKEAEKRGLSLMHRSEALAKMMSLKKNIVVAGSHGKTTSTAFLANIFFHSGWSPTVVAGGRLNCFQSTAFLGQGEWFIAESDESDGSFHYLFPELVLLTNIDKDHLDFYGDFLKMKKSFSKFLKKIPTYGSVIACGDCDHTKEVVDTISDRKVWFYGFKDHNDFLLKKRDSFYSVYHKQEKWLDMESPLKGDYNALNALGSIVCSFVAGMKKTEILQSLKKFNGVQRRREFKGVWKGCLFFDDYAHHPTEISSVLYSFKEEFPNRRILVLFQPHRWSRFKNCWNAFLKCFSFSDKLFIMPVYPAGEQMLKGFDSVDFVKQFQTKPVQFVKKEKLFSVFSKEIKEGDLFVSLGAGSVYFYAEKLLSQLKEK